MTQVFDMEDSRWQMMGNYKPWYIGWANCDDEAATFLRQFYRRPEFLPDDSESGRRDWFFLGTPGFGAPYHIDNVKYPSWQAQVLLHLYFQCNAKLFDTIVWCDLELFLSFQKGNCSRTSQRE